MLPILIFRGEHRFLSNFYRCFVPYEGITYPSVEHAYQAAKTLDPVTREQIARCGAPGVAKAMGRTVELRGDWDQIKVNVMEELLRIKFADPMLRGLLVKTGTAELVEGNTWRDTFWGVFAGRGRNELGKALMRVRSACQQGWLF
jgi:N-glycosidase YbiA